MENKIVLSLKDTNQYFKKTELKMSGYDNGTLVIELATLNEYSICRYSIGKESFKKVGSNVKQIKTVNEFLAAFKLILKDSIKDADVDQLVKIEDSSSTTMLFMGLVVWTKAIMLAAKKYPDKMQSFITTWHDNLKLNVVDNNQDDYEKSIAEKVHKKSKKEIKKMRLSAMAAEVGATRIKEVEDSIYEIDDKKAMLYYDGNPFIRAFHELFDILIKQNSFKKDESGFLKYTYFECLQLMNDLEWLYKKHDGFFCQAWGKFLYHIVNLIELAKSETRKNAKGILSSFAFDMYIGVEKLSNKFDEELKIAEEKDPTWFHSNSEFYKDWVNDLVEEIRNEAVE